MTPVLLGLPGSSCLYVKLFTNPLHADDVLVHLYDGVISTEIQSGRSTHWFFIRYDEGGYHLRIRVFYREPTFSLRGLQTLLDALSQQVRDGRVWRVQVDTYRRELVRYGGLAAMEGVERLFAVDSEAVASALRGLANQGDDPVARIELAVAGLSHWASTQAHHFSERALLITPDSIKGWSDRAQRMWGRRLYASVRSAWWDGQTTKPKSSARCLLEDALSNAGSVVPAHAFDGLSAPTTERIVRGLLHLHINRVFRALEAPSEAVLYDVWRRYMLEHRGRAGIGST